MVIGVGPPPVARALVAAEEIHYDEHYQFGRLHEPIDQIVVFDCGANPNRAIKNPKVTHNRNDLELPGTIVIQDFEIEVTKPIFRPGRVELWRTKWMLASGYEEPLVVAASLPVWGRSLVERPPPFGLSNPDVIGLDGVGTCDYGDLCSILDVNRPHNPTCPCEATCFQDWIDLGIPKEQCSCEGIIAPKVYSIPNWNKEIHLTGLDQGLVTWIWAEADFEIKLIAEDANGNEEACIGVWLPIREYAPPNDTGGWFLSRKKRAQARQSL
ncbi:uncharacterized protein [Branchiostoma lanceolatum]|uniref:uncharacterized protein n=1 Tax=Branchiostoma lanceolatum TaxID=7740 RepID=UPI003455ABA9